MKMKIAVFGGCGFLGSHLVETLLTNGQDVRVFDQPSARYLEYSSQLGANIVTGNFLDPNDVGKALAGCDAVYHLISATVPQTSNENPRYDVEANLIGTLQLLEQMRVANVKKIIFASSGGTVYGIPHEIPVKESHPTDPISSYGITKLAIEKYIHLYRTLYGLDYCILRIANAYGERQPITGTQGVIGAFLDKAIHNAEVTVWGDGSTMRDYTYIGDIVNAFVKAVNYEGEPKVFNIGAGQGHSLNDIIEIIGQIIRQPLKAKYQPGRTFDIPINVLDISSAKMYLNWQPTVGIFEGISRAYEWMLMHP